MSPTIRKGHPAPSPSELRSMFGANLRQLAQSSVSISQLCRDLGINRTQFNRYLAGESFPRPDVLYRICAFFEVDARILLEPVETIVNIGDDLFSHPEVKDFLGTGPASVDENLLPTGLYRFSRASFIDDGSFVISLVQIYRKGIHCFVRGYEAREAMRQQGLPETPAEREFRGVIVPQEGGIAMLVSRRNALTFSFNYMTPHTSFQNNYWVGYTTRTAPESVTGKRATRLVLEHLNRSFGEKLSAARKLGLRVEKDLVPFHARQLRIGEPFA